MPIPYARFSPIPLTTRSGASVHVAYVSRSIIATPSATSKITQGVRAIYCSRRFCCPLMLRRSWQTAIYSLAQSIRPN
jgi:hypothetical protein